MTTRAARLNPATRKQPLACLHCGCKKLVRKGTRRKKLELVQLWQCTYCRHVFTPLPPEARNTTYPPRVIIEALTTYCLGYSLTWSATNASSCMLSLSDGATYQNWPLSGSGQSGPFVGTETLTCSNSAGSASASVTISP